MPGRWYVESSRDQSRLTPAMSRLHPLLAWQKSPHFRAAKFWAGVQVCVCVCVRERGRERKRKRKRERERERERERGRDCVGLGCNWVVGCGSERYACLRDVLAHLPPVCLLTSLPS